jgi:nicotinamidase-related amidase
MPETALIVIDMLNRYEHEDAEPLIGSVEEQLPQIVGLRDRAAASDEVLLVYSNDNFEHWESTRDDLVRDALEGARPDLVAPIVPPADVPFLPKGRHSIFYETPVAHVLQTQGIRRVVMCGQVTEQCILYSALDAVLRGYDVEIPTDAVAHVVPEFAEAALGMMRDNLHAEVRDGREVVLPG